MINFTQLLHGRGIVSEAIKYRRRSPHLVPTCFLRFAETHQPVVFWNITRRCNLSCMHCYISAGPFAQRNGELSLNEAKSFIDDLAEIRIPLLMFTGGEPLVKENFWELLSYARSKGLRTALSTNGTLITEDVAVKLRDFGVEYVGISLDGANEETHDTFRKQPGSFKRAVQGLRNCVRVGLRCGIRFTVTRYNYTEILPLIDFSLQLKVPRFCIYWLVPSGRGEVFFTEGNVERDDTIRILNMLYEKTKELGPEQMEILTVCAPQDGVYILYRLKKEKQSAYSDALKLLDFMGGACSAGDRLVSVDPMGNVYPCQFAQLSELKIGNIRQKKFSELWNDPNNPILSLFRNKKMYLKGKCGLCAYKDLCGGGCRVRAYKYYGDLWAEDPFCTIRLDTNDKLK